jgi:type VI secretion system secreted protein VgrG
MSSYSQNDHPLQIQTPLGQDVLLLDRMEGEEAVSSLFEFRLRMRSPRTTIDPARIIGQPVTISVVRTDGSRGTRYFNGLVTRFENHGTIDGGLALYSAVVRPWLWLLSQTTDCRVYRGSSLDIARQIFADAGSFPFEVKAANPPARDYCVQYNESDLAFVSRLLEDDGIFYYFRHDDGKHTLVLGDSVSALTKSAEATVSFQSNLSGHRLDDRLKAWAHGYELRSGKWAHTDYNFQTPDTALVTQGASGKLPGMSSLELFEYPGDHDAVSPGTTRAGVRADQATFEYDQVVGQSLVETFSPGYYFAVGEHHAADEQGKSYVLTSVHHVADQSGSYDDARGSGGAATVYSNRFTAVVQGTNIRPARRTQRPRVRGPLTAVVVGPSGEEIYTDKFGRIKVQFHWDRYGKRDENSSCWVRVAFLAAGGGFGMVSVPRVGHEVVVEFLDGDPDRPLVTGCVYNAKNMPPVSAAGRDSGGPSDTVGAKMQATLRSNSTGGSGGFNEITMNDTGGAETLFVKAQKDEIHTVGNNRKNSVKNNETHSVGNDRMDSVGHDEKRNVGHDQTVTIGRNRSDSVGNDETRAVGHDQLVTISNDQVVVVGRNRNDTVTKDATLAVGNDRTQVVGANEKVTIGGDMTVTVSGSESSTAKQVSITGNAQLTLSCGASTIQMTPAMVSIVSPMVKINC